jgi:hypothetical protein
MITYVPGYMNLGIISTNIVGSNTSVFSRKIFDSINGYEEHDRKIFEGFVDFLSALVLRIVKDVSIR